jgi:uncharacterized protein
MLEVDGKTRKSLERAFLRLAEAQSRKDIAGVMEFATPDAVYLGNGWENFRNVRVQGADALKEMLRFVAIEYESLGLALHEAVFDGDSVACRRTMRLRRRGGGRTADVVICGFFRFRDGRVCEVHEMFDTQAMLELDA